MFFKGVISAPFSLIYDLKKGLIKLVCESIESIEKLKLTGSSKTSLIVISSHNR